MHNRKNGRELASIESEPFTSCRTIKFSQVSHSNCCCIQFKWEPIGYISLILVCVNTLGYAAVVHLADRDDYVGAVNKDVIGSYFCFGLSYVMVAIPTIIAPGVLLRSQTSAFLICVWSLLYQFWLYHGVYSRLSITNEIDWIRWVLISFGLLLPHSLGLACSSFGKFNHFNLGSTMAVFSLLIMIVSNIREGRSINIGQIDNLRNETPQSDESTMDNATYVSWMTNCFFWFGILLLNSNPCSNHQRRWCSSWLVLIPALLYGSSLLLLTHPHFHIIASTIPLLQTVDVNPIKLAFHDVSLNPTLQQMNTKKVVIDFETDKFEEQDNQTWRKEIAKIPVLNKFDYKQRKNDSKSKIIDIEFSVTPVAPISTSTQCFKTFMDSAAYPFTANTSTTGSNCHCQNIVGLGKNSRLNPSIFTMNSLEVSSGTHRKARFEGVAKTVTTIVCSTRPFLTLFKLKITSELLYGPWI
jgi:hypothetical protein